LHICDTPGGSVQQQTQRERRLGRNIELALATRHYKHKRNSKYQKRFLQNYRCLLCKVQFTSRSTETFDFFNEKWTQQLLTFRGAQGFKTYHSINKAMRQRSQKTGLALPSSASQLYKEVEGSGC